jgi:site-specific DNA-methyltransferase (adenine-specific)
VLNFVIPSSSTLFCIEKHNIDEASGKLKRALTQVKSGHVKSGDVRDLRSTVEREGAQLGVFITLDPATSEMQREALAARFYHSPALRRDYPKIQILTIPDLPRGAEVKMPQQALATFKQARRVNQVDVQQHGFDLQPPED